MAELEAPRFDDPHLARIVEHLPIEALDRLPFGCIRLDRNGIVTLYSDAERRLSGSGHRPRLGLHFFAEVAPCMDTPRFRQRIENDLASGNLDLEFTWIGDFADRTRELSVRAQSASGGGCWIFMRRENSEPLKV